VNLEESDALAGIVFFQKPTTRLRIIRLDTDAFAAQTIGRSSVLRDRAAPIQSSVSLV
jgi:hypothetical protein